MSSVGDGEGPRRTGRPRVRVPDRVGGSGRQAWRGEQLALADISRSISVVETAGQVELDLAQTLRAIAAHDHGETAARRLRLAEDAARGAQSAAQASERLQQHAQRRAEQAEVIGLRQALDHVARALADLTRAQNDVTRILTHLSRNAPDLAAQRRQLASAASAAEQHARNLAAALHRLAEKDADEAKPDGSPME